MSKVTRRFLSTNFLFTVCADSLLYIFVPIDFRALTDLLLSYLTSGLLRAEYSWTTYCHHIRKWNISILDWLNERRRMWCSLDMLHYLSNLSTGRNVYNNNLGIWHYTNSFLLNACTTSVTVQVLCFRPLLIYSCLPISCLFRYWILYIFICYICATPCYSYNVYMFHRHIWTLYLKIPFKCISIMCTRFR